MPYPIRAENAEQKAYLAARTAARAVENVAQTDSVDADTENSAEAAHASGGQMDGTAQPQIAAEHGSTGQHSNDLDAHDAHVHHAVPLPASTLASPREAMTLAHRGLPERTQQPLEAAPTPADTIAVPASEDHTAPPAEMVRQAGQRLHGAPSPAAAAAESAGLVEGHVLPPAALLGASTQPASIHGGPSSMTQTGRKRSRAVGAPDGGSPPARRRSGQSS